MNKHNLVCSSKWRWVILGIAVCEMGKTAGVYLAVLENSPRSLVTIRRTVFLYIILISYSYIFVGGGKNKTFINEIIR